MVDIPIEKEDLVPEFPEVPEVEDEKQLDAEDMVEIAVNESSENYVDVSIPPSPQKATLLGPQIDQAFAVQTQLFAENIANPLNLSRKKSPIMPFQSHTSSLLNSNGQGQDKVPVQIP